MHQADTGARGGMARERSGPLAPARRTVQLAGPDGAMAVTAFETASLEFQAASLVFQEMTAWAGLIAAVAAVVIGLLQCGLLFKGLRMMERGNGERAAALEQRHLADNQRHDEAVAAHAETMAENQRRALETVIERTARAEA